MSEPAHTQQGIVAGRQHGQRTYMPIAWAQLPIHAGFGTRNTDLDSYLGSTGKHTATEQVHGTVIHSLTPRQHTATLRGDAFVTEHPHVVCAVRTADCVPILLYNPVRKICGAIHSGWRGLCAGIIQDTLHHCRRTYGSQIAHTLIAIGPCIGTEHYEVSRDVIEQFESAGFTVPDCERLDLTTLCIDAVHGVGVPMRNIVSIRRSTFSHPHEFHSFRRDPNNPGRQWSYIVMK